MTIFSKHVFINVGHAFSRQMGASLRFLDVSGNVSCGPDWLGQADGIRHRRSLALQESLNKGAAHVFEIIPGVLTFLVAGEDRRMVHGGVLGPEVRVAKGASAVAVVEDLVARGMRVPDARRGLAHLPAWSEARLCAAAECAQTLFYEAFHWTPELMSENRLKAQQMAQINQAVQDLKSSGQPALYAFEKERALLAHIRVGDQSGARRILNEMLAVIYMSSPTPPVLRARAVELMSCLTRAAIEDNPLMEPLIERNHVWTERLIGAGEFEDLSAMLTRALDEFMDDIYLQGVNRSNALVQKAMDYIGRHFDEPIKLEQLARAAGISASRLSHLIKAYTGRTFLQTLFAVRIRHAQHLLLYSTLNVTEIAYEVGFGDQSYFIKQFKRLTGTTPARYRRARLRGRVSP